MLGDQAGLDESDLEGDEWESVDEHDDYEDEEEAEANGGPGV